MISVIGCSPAPAHNRSVPVYLDNAATSFPKPPVVYEQLAAYQARYGASPGRGSYAWAREAEAAIDDARAALAQLFHVREPRRIAFALNATDALNMAIKGVLRPGDHVVTTMLEHNSVMRPLAALERARIITVTRVAASPDGFVDPDDVRRALTPATRLVAVIHASNVLGTVQPVTVIGHHVRECGALFLVDAAQTAGRYPLHVESACIDLLAFPGHKGLLGPPGTGGLYVGPRAERCIRPWREGGTGVLSELAVQPDELPLRLEAGSPNTWGVAALGAAARFLLQESVERVHRHELALLAQLVASLSDDARCQLYGGADLSRRVAVLSLNLGGVDPQVVGDALDRECEVAVRCGLHCAPGAHRSMGTFPDGTVRISPGYFTTSQEIASAVASLQFVAERLGATAGLSRAADIAPMMSEG